MISDQGWFKKMKQSYEMINDELKGLDDFLSSEGNEQYSDMLNLNDLIVRVDKSSYMRKTYRNEMKENATKEILNNEKNLDLACETEEVGSLCDKKAQVDKFDTLLNMM